MRKTTFSRDEKRENDLYLPGLDGLSELVVFFLAVFLPHPLVSKWLMKIFSSLWQQLFSFLIMVICFIFGLFLITVLIISYPTVFSAEQENSFFGLAKNLGSLVTDLSKVLAGYREPGFEDGPVPVKNPFGGDGWQMVETTAFFGDQYYYKIFGVRHEGIDLVPNKKFYQESRLFKIAGAAVVLATHNGWVKTYFDSYGALTVEIVNEEGSLKTVYKHLQKIIVSNNNLISAGEPLGIMGTTGFSTGQHLHYEVRLNNGGQWVTVNPGGFIH